MERFIDPQVLARARNLELVARSVARGFLQGLHDSEQRGVGIEFSQYRSYEPGDAPSRIDWKLYARSDKFFVREAERESDNDVWLLLDASQSMALSSEQGAWNKFDYARHLLAALAYIAANQGDRVGLMVLSDTGIQHVPVMSGLRHWQRILHTLESSTVAGCFPEPTVLKAEVGRLQGAGLVLLLSDLYEQRTEIEAFLRQISTVHNEVAVLQLSCEDELTFPFEGPIQFEDLETGEIVLTSAKAARPRYLAQRELWQRETRLGLGRYQIDLEPLNIDAPLDQALASFLERRRRPRVP